MPAKRIPKPRQEDIDSAVQGLLEVIDIDSLSDVDRFFALDLLGDYGKWCAISEAAWTSISTEGTLSRTTTGGKGNNHYKLTKSESINVFKDARAAKSDLAVKISRFVKSGTMVQEEEESPLNAFLSRR